MRLGNAPRVAHDATVELGSGGRARAVNLSTGGIFVTAEKPLDPGEQVHLKVNLRDGAAPLDVDAEVVWRADGGMALRFVALDDVGRRRIQRLVQKREPTHLGRRDVRIHLPELSAPLRATARDLTERGVMIEAELPWLRLGSAVTTELSPDRACDGHVQWIGLDVTRSGSARLRIFVDLADENAPAPPPEVVADQAAQAAAAHAAGTADTARAASPRQVLPVDVDVTTSEPPRSRWRWLWPSLAIAATLTAGGLGVALMQRPPAPTLLPTTPPERDSSARLPAQRSLPRAGDATNAAPTAAAAIDATKPEAPKTDAKSDAAKPDTVKSDDKKAQPAHAKPHRSRHTHATRRAE